MEKNIVDKLYDAFINMDHSHACEARIELAGRSAFGKCSCGHDKAINLFKQLRALLSLEGVDGIAYALRHKETKRFFVRVSDDGSITSDVFSKDVHLDFNIDRIRELLSDYELEDFVIVRVTTRTVTVRNFDEVES